MPYISLVPSTWHRTDCISNPFGGPQDDRQLCQVALGAWTIGTSCVPWLLDLIQLFKSEGCVEEFILVEGNFCVMSKVKVSVFCRWWNISIGAAGTVQTFWWFSSTSGCDKWLKQRPWVTPPCHWGCTCTPTWQVLLKMLGWCGFWPCRKWWKRNVSRLRVAKFGPDSWETQQNSQENDDFGPETPFEILAF